MITKQFVSAVAARSGLSTSAVKSCLTAMQKVTADELKEKGEVRVPGLVSLKTMKRAEREARNPKTGEPCKVGAGITVKSKPVSTLSSLVVNQS